MKIFNFLFLLTGFTGLIYEVSWHKFLSTYTGSDFRGSSIVLGLMLGAMGIGYYYFGKKAKNLQSKEIFKLTAYIAVSYTHLTLPTICSV